MESEDMQSNFSTLNVNAVEFVPSFAATVTTANEPDDPAEEDATAPVEVPENNGNGESYANSINIFDRRKFLPHRMVEREE